MRDRDFEKLKPNDLVEITVPSTLKVEKRLIEGDIIGSVRFEVTTKDTGEEEGLDKYWKEILLKGGRVFITEDDMPLIIHSEESLKFKEAIRMPRVGQ